MYGNKHRLLQHRQCTYVKRKTVAPSYNHCYRGEATMLSLVLLLTPQQYKTFDVTKEMQQWVYFCTVVELQNT